MHTEFLSAPVWKGPYFLPVYMRQAFLNGMTELEETNKNEDLDPRELLWIFSKNLKHGTHFLKVFSIKAFMNCNHRWPTVIKSFQIWILFKNN